MYGYIYKIRNKVNGKLYIGQHKKSTFNSKYYGSGKIIKQAVKKYGKHQFEIKILRKCDTYEDLNKWEKSYIDQYRKKYQLYNIDDGGLGISSELASQKAIDRWSKTSVKDRQKHMAPARKAQQEMRENGSYTTKTCNECGARSAHKKSCSKFKEQSIKCDECKSKAGHKKSCSKFIPIRRTKATREKIKKAAIERAKDETYKQKISTALKQKWENEEYRERTRCQECSGLSRNHKQYCSKAKTCTECGRITHLKTCSRYTPLTTHHCVICDKVIHGIGNYRQHIKSKKHKENQLNK